MRTEVMLVNRTHSRVELNVAEHYASLGYCAIRSENSYWGNLFSLLMYDVLYAPYPHSICGFCSYPNFNSLSYVEEVLPAFYDFFGGQRDLRRAIADNYRLHTVEDGRSNYDGTVGGAERFSINDYLAAIQHLSPDVLMKVFENMLVNFGQFGFTGFPDLVVHDAAEFFLVEVKGPGDRVSPHQRFRLSFLESIGIQCIVVNATYGSL